MNREITKISLQGITGVDRIRAIDIISAALAAQYHRNIMVLNEGYASDAAIDQIPNTVKIFVVEAEKKHAVQEQIGPLDFVETTQDTSESVQIVGDFIVQNGKSPIADALSGANG